MTPEVGQIFGPYEILGRVGSGGMGLVFRAWDERLHREVAIKLVRDNYRVPGMKERFLQEARAASRLNHPNICTIFDIGEKDGDPYLVMELLEGETLKEKIQRSALSAEEIVVYAREISDALATAHAKGIIHRDIKPANIFLVKKPGTPTQAKVLDFGLAKVSSTPRKTRISPIDDERHTQRYEDSPLDLTMEGVTVGTVSYMSPEQARGHALDPRSDLFSLGIVMYEMATRRTPFRGTNSSQVFVQILEHDPEPVRNWNESIPRELERIILKLLSKDRRKRFQNARELNAALEKISGRLTKGTWLRTNSPGPVPIVRSLEPVARDRRRIKRDSGAHPVPQVRDSHPDSASILIRPLRIPTNEIDIQPAKLATPQKLDAPQTTAVLIAGSSSTGVAGSTGDSVAAAAHSLARGSSSMVQFEYGFDEAATPEVELTPDNNQKHHALKQWTARLAIAICVAALAVTGVITLRGGRFITGTFGPQDVLLLTAIQDKTGDALGGAVLEGLDLSLMQSQKFTVRSYGSYQAGLRQIETRSNAQAAPSPRAIAQQVGAKAYLFGEIVHAPGDAASYTIRVDALRSDTNDLLLSLTERADSRSEIPAAIDRLARSLRLDLGEDRGSVSSNSTSLHQQATSDIDALKAYAEGDQAAQTGNALGALSAYRQAIARDSQFAQAPLKIAWLSYDQHAEVEAADAAQRAMVASKTGDDRIRLLSEFCYEMLATGDYSRAASTIRQYNEQFPGDAEGMVSLARVLRAQGHLVESLLAAQQAYEQDASKASAYTEAQLAMIGLDRYADAMKLDAQANKRGVLPGRAALPASYLAGRTDRLADLTRSLEGSGPTHRSPSPAELAAYALYLDNAAKWADGEHVWTRAVATASTTPGLSSAAASMLAQAALNRALAGRCSEALPFLQMARGRSQGPAAVFRAGIANALCNRPQEAENAIDALDRMRSSGLDSAKSGTFELKAAIALSKKDPAQALQLLEEAEPVDPALLPYLRQRAYVALGKPQQAADNLQSIADHRGAVYLSGVSLYGQAIQELARLNGHNEPVLAAR
ncbi:MAG: protein kinase [Acidobacteria bacterium]|nr:protein kinase [Acidobacteriota bacterium]